LSLEAFSQEKSTLSLEEVKVRAIAALYDSDSISLERSWKPLFDDALAEVVGTLQVEKIDLLLRFTGGQDYACRHGAELVDNLRIMSARESVLNLLIPFYATKWESCVSAPCANNPEFIEYILKQAGSDKLGDIPGKLVDARGRVGFASDLQHVLNNYYVCTHDYKYLGAIIRMLGANLADEKFSDSTLYMIEDYFEDGAMPKDQRSRAIAALEAVEQSCSDLAWKKTLHDKILEFKKIK
jgi:hypothetical protein